jgi:hypothetical protein
VDFDRAVAAVRAVFLDVDLAVRSKIHRGVRLAWLPREDSGERRLRQQTRIMDRMQVEEVVIEEGPGGTWVKRYVDGPNAGTRFVAAFDAQGDAGARVTMDAYVGGRGFEQGLGRLSPLGLEKAMKRLMNEYRTALQGYEPGRARGSVLAALGEARAQAQAMYALDETRRKQLTAALLESALAIACVDEGPDDAERDALRAIVAAIWRATLDASIEERMVKTAVDAVAKEGAEARCTRLGERLRALGFGELGLTLAVFVAEVSHGLDPAELEALRAMSAAAGVDELALMTIIQSMDRALSGGDSPSRMSSFV